MELHAILADYIKANILLQLRSSGIMTMRLLPLCNANCCT